MSWLSKLWYGMVSGVETKVSVVEHALSPVFGPFVAEMEAVVKKAGVTAFNAAISQARVIAAAVANDPAMKGKSGVDKWNAFESKFLAWALATYPIIATLSGPAWRATLEMAIAAAITAAAA